MPLSIKPGVVSIGEAMIEFAPVGDGLYRRGFAGDTFNTAWHMKQLLGEGSRVGYFTRVGEDRLSSAFLAELAADGLDISAIGRDGARQMGLYLIELDGVERNFHYWRGQSAARHLADDPVLLDTAFSEAGLIYLSGVTLAILPVDSRERLFTALRQARSKGAVISFDPNIRARLWISADEMRAAMSTMLTIADIALPSFDDERTHWNDKSPEGTIRRMRALGVREVVVKDGAGAVHVDVEGQTTVIATPPVANIRDTTGAGDAFNAGYLAARLTGSEPSASVGMGQRLAGEVLQHFGARAPCQRVAELARLLE